MKKYLVLLPLIASCSGVGRYNVGSSRQSSKKKVADINLNLMKISLNKMIDGLAPSQQLICNHSISTIPECNILRNFEQILYYKLDTVYSFPKGSNFTKSVLERIAPDPSVVKLASTILGVKENNLNLEIINNKKKFKKLNKALLDPQYSQDRDFKKHFIEHLIMHLFLTQRHQSVKETEEYNKEREKNLSGMFHISSNPDRCVIKFLYSDDVLDFIFKAIDTGWLDIVQVLCKSGFDPNKMVQKHFKMGFNQ